VKLVIRNLVLLKRYFFCFFILGLCPFLSAKGKTEPPEPNNKDTVVVITQFDVSDFPPERAAVGGVIARKLTTGLNGLDFKKRDGKEYDYYWSILWMKKQNEAAKKLASKQAERDKLIFSGSSDWKYKKDLAKVDKELETLRETLEAAELTDPSLAELPHFTVTTDNLAGVFPDPPTPGEEYFYCQDKKADAILKGKVHEYYGRVLLELEMWTVWDRSYSFKDKTIFSIEDIDVAMNELIIKLIDSISGMEASVLVVSAKPDTAAIVIDDNYAGKGTSNPVHRTPGPVDVVVYADNYDTVNATLDVKENEEVKAEFDLKPLPVDDYTVDVTEQKKSKYVPEGEEPEDKRAKVYQGAFFSGFAPLELSGLEGNFQQINVEQNAINAKKVKGKISTFPETRHAQTIFQIGTKDNIDLTPKVSPAIGRTEKARKGFYGAFGRLWIGLPIAFVLMGIADSYLNSWKVLDKTKFTDAAAREEQFNKTKTWYNVKIGAGIGIGLLAADAVIRFFIYMYQANRESSILATK